MENMLEWYIIISEDSMTLCEKVDDDYKFAGTYSRASSIDTLGNSELIFCGYDYNGYELYSGYIVRIGLDGNGEQYAVGTIEGYTDNGLVQVKFSDIVERGEYDMEDYYYIEGLSYEIEKNGYCITSVEPYMLQLYFFD